MCARLKLNRRRSLLCIALAAFAATESTSAAPFIWDGGGTTNNWTDAINWSTNVAPPNDGSAPIVFTGAVRPNPLVDVSFNIFSLGFDPGSSPFTIGGSPLTIQNGGISNFDDS